MRTNVTKAGSTANCEIMLSCTFHHARRLLWGEMISPSLRASLRFIVPLMIRPSFWLACFTVFLTGVSPLTPQAEAEEAAASLRELLPGEPTRTDLTRALKMLQDWESGTQQEKERRVLRVCYWTPADRAPQPRHRERLTGVLRHIQNFYLREMAAWGFPGRTIQLDLGNDGLLKLHEVRGTLKSAECSETDSSDGRAIRSDCLRALREEAGIDGDKETLVIFCNLADWDPATRQIGHHSPYYASGNSQHGTAWQVDSVLLDAASLGVKDQHVQDRQYGRISLGKYNSIFVGGVCHELGHALGLPHCREDAAMRATRGKALMGSGNRTYGDELRGDGRGSFLTLTHALKLAAHPQFSGSVRQMGTGLRAKFSDWQLVPNAAALRVSATVSGNLPVHAVLAYADPEGGGDYDSANAVGVPDASGRFTLTLPAPEKNNTTALLHFVAVAVNGAATAGVWSSQAISMSARITTDAAYDVTKAVQKIEFDAAWPEVQAGKAVPTTVSPAVGELFRRLRTPDSSVGKPAPSAVPADKMEVALSDMLPAQASTGWQGVHFDRTPEGTPLEGPEGLFIHGLYAHAEAVHEYDLSGKWDKLTGSACLLRQGFGVVQATILGDGRVLWTSPDLKSDVSASFEVSLKGVQRLTLRMHGLKGKNGAWGAWGEPLLRRAAP